MKVKKLLCGALAFLLSVSCLVACGEKEKDTHVCAENLKLIPPADSTCLVQGHKAYYLCTVCDKIYSDNAATNPLTEGATLRPLMPHETEVCNETVGDYSDFYYCRTCGKYFTDEPGGTKIPYSELTDSSVKPVKLTDVSTGNLLITKSVDNSAAFEDIYEDFTVRFFVGWSNAESDSYEDFTDGNVAVYINLNRIETLSGGQNWYNFGVGYDAERGLCFKDFESGEMETASQEFNSLFLKKGGIYVRVVRKGGTVSFYFEDAFGVPRLIRSNGNFGTSSPLVRLAANDPAPGTTAKLGWTPFVKETAVCLGIGNPRCVFDGAYDENGTNVLSADA